MKDDDEIPEVTDGEDQPATDLNTEENNNQ